VRNSITGALIGFMTLTAIVLASFTHASPGWSVATFVGLALGYVAIYARMVKHGWYSPISFLFVKPRQCISHTKGAA
jgi:ABC-type nitrate/sulfonate/bicarbonate transport system permease component